MSIEDIMNPDLFTEYVMIDSVDYEVQAQYIKMDIDAGYIQDDIEIVSVIPKYAEGNQMDHLSERTLSEIWEILITKHGI